jgi:hypothetical protein
MYHKPRKTIFVGVMFTNFAILGDLGGHILAAGNMGRYGMKMW